MARRRERWATGDLKIEKLHRHLHEEVHDLRDNRPEEESDFWMRMFDLARTDPEQVGVVREVPADPARRIVSRQDWIGELGRTTGLPVGYGYLPSAQRCPDVYPDKHSRRACYWFDEGRFRFLALMAACSVAIRPGASTKLSSNSLSDS